MLCMLCARCAVCWLLRTTHTHVFVSQEHLPELHYMRVPQLAVVHELALHIAQHQVWAL